VGRDVVLCKLFGLIVGVEGVAVVSEVRLKLGLIKQKHIKDLQMEHPKTSTLAQEV
jgi:hypothetical protein